MRQSIFLDSAAIALAKITRFRCAESPHLVPLNLRWTVLDVTASNKASPAVHAFRSTAASELGRTAAEAFVYQLCERRFLQLVNGDLL